MFTIVDDEDYNELNKFKWYTQKIKHLFYARRAVGARICRKSIYMHHVVLDFDSKILEVDHIDGDGLNNQKYNLRVVSHKENCCNFHR